MTNKQPEALRLAENLEQFREGLKALLAWAVKQGGA